jgi:hypothetical protein
MELIIRILEIVFATFRDPSMLWEVIPLMLDVIIMELYLIRHRDEELSWESSLSHSLILVYVGMNLLHYLSLQYNFSLFDPRLLIALIILSVGCGLAYLNYFHKLPKKILFGFSSVLPINYIAFLGTIYVHGFLRLDFTTLIAASTIFVIFLAIIKLGHFLRRNR